MEIHWTSHPWQTYMILISFSPDHVCQSEYGVGVIHRTNTEQTAAEIEESRRILVERHSVILGLCAFVNAYPYEVPEFVPDFLMILGDHLHDPEPIPVRFFFFKGKNEGFIQPYSRASDT